MGVAVSVRGRKMEENLISGANGNERSELKRAVIPKFQL